LGEEQAKMETISAKISPDTLQKLEELARERGMPISSMVRLIIERSLQRKNGNEDKITEVYKKCMGEWKLSTCRFTNRKAEVCEAWDFEQFKGMLQDQTEELTVPVVYNSYSKITKLRPKLNPNLCLYCPLHTRRQ
jgi:hypothetical protein